MCNRFLTQEPDKFLILVAGEVKTTSPKRFCVRPNSGIISPKSAYDFSVTMQGLRSAASEVECKDKFLIQSTVVDSGLKEEDVTLELFSKSSGKYVEEKKLRVVLKVEDPVEVKAALTTEDPKPSGDSDGNERDLSKNLNFNPVKVVKEDQERKL
nr:vesicle-associated protein 2-2-like [Tanacetum cinerariifolium]